MRSLLLIAACLVVSACRLDTTIDAKDYLQTCSVNADCVLVAEGDACSLCGGCQTSAINLSAKASFDSDVTTLKSSCPPRLFQPPVACATGACLQPEAFCNAGTCDTRPVTR
ncbi:MAG: hypothetical protein Q8S33_31560 [Myxococcales bacterium]|nr:hypothetical protein [Myxococcales bacterium]MDP3504917.1 hypothetical protein [Myxococcales bacterium]